MQGHTNMKSEIKCLNKTWCNNNNNNNNMYSLLTYLLTYPMQQSPSWVANRFSASQEIPHI